MHHKYTFSNTCTTYIIANSLFLHPYHSANRDSLLIPFTGLFSRSLYNRLTKQPQTATIAWRPIRYRQTVHQHLGKNPDFCTYVKHPFFPEFDPTSGHNRIQPFLNDFLNPLSIVLYLTHHILPIPS